MFRSLQRVGRIAFVSALIAWPVVAAAQQPSPLGFGISAGLSEPIGDLGSAANGGYNVTGHAWYAPRSMQTVSLRGDIGYDSWGSKGGSFTFRSLSFTGNGLYHFSQTNGSIFSPYAIAGLGFYNLKTQVNGSTQSASNTNFGIQGGAGFEVRLAGFATFAELKIVNVFGDGGSSAWVPLTFGIHF